LGRRRHHDSVFNLGVLRERHLGLDFAGIGIKNVANAAGISVGLLPANKMANFTHW
jgi:hypothetical protein